MYVTIVPNIQADEVSIKSIRLPLMKRQNEFGLLLVFVFAVVKNPHTQQSYFEVSFYKVCLSDLYPWSSFPTSV